MSDGIHEFLAAVGQLWKLKLITVAGVKLSFGNVLVALTLLLFSTRLSGIISRIINKKLIAPLVPDRSSQNSYQTFTFYGCLAGLVSLSLTIAGIPLTVFTVVGGALAIGVGFGSQNIVNNFISGIIILVEKPIRVGDLVDIDSVTGAVYSIGTRSTKIKTADNKILIVPNSFFLEKSVMNWSYDSTILRNSVKFGVAYGSDVRLVENTCMDILLNHEDIEQTPMPFVVFDDFADSSLNFTVFFFCDLEKIASLPMVRSDIRFKIDDKFRQNKIEMAFPQRDIHLKMKHPLDVKVLS